MHFGSSVAVYLSFFLFPFRSALFWKCAVLKSMNVKNTNLKLEGDATDRTLLDAHHEMGHVARNLVAHPLRRDERNLSADALVDVEVEGQARVVLLNDRTRCLLNCLGANAAHLFSTNKKQTKKTTQKKVQEKNKYQKTQTKKALFYSLSSLEKKMS